MLCFQLYPRPSRTRDARYSVREMTCCTREPEISSRLHLIHRLNQSIDRSRTFQRGFRASFATAQHQPWPKY